MLNLAGFAGRCFRSCSFLFFVLFSTFASRLKLPEAIVVGAPEMDCFNWELHLWLNSEINTDWPLHWLQHILWAREYSGYIHSVLNNFFLNLFWMNFATVISVGHSIYESISQGFNIEHLTDRLKFRSKFILLSTTSKFITSSFNVTKGTISHRPNLNLVFTW